ncbi:uncharacterized protein ACN427_014850 isoform 1-T1 [Glossina fuscipes fuscipes]|nr:hypothetical protein GQX74_002109 [Glossina fuscipes]
MQSLGRMLDEEHYRHGLRNHFMGQVKNSKLQKYCQGALQDTPAQYIKEQALRGQQKMHEYEMSKQKQTPQPRPSGGDAERMLCDPAFSSQISSDSYRQKSSDYALRQLHCNPKAPAPATPMNPCSPIHNKYIPDDCPDRYLFETDSNFGGVCCGSDESVKSQKTSKTVVSRKSSQELRKIVKSKCKLHEVIDETLKQMCRSDDGSPDGKHRYESKDNDMPAAHCKHCSDKMLSRQSQKDVMTEIGKGDFLDCRNGDTLTISVDDVVNSKVINPMIRKLQRMYLNNLKEEMSLMEDLEKLPHKVNEVYKATIFKQKD